MYIVVLVTVQAKKEAEDIARVLLKNRLIACANIVEGINSFFWWQGRIDKAKEVLLIAKSKKTKFPRIIKLVKSMHSYDIPEIIAIPLMGGEKEYLRWIDESVR